MEVSTVSPPPTSPTEGDDLCDIDVTDVAIHSVMLLISLCGLVGNGAVISLIVMNSISEFIFDMTVADFLFLLFTVPSALLFLVEDVSCSPILSPVYVSFLFQLSVVSYYWGIFWLMRVTLILDTRQLCQLCCRCDIPNRVLLLMDSALFWAFFTLFTAIPTLTLLCPYEQERCRAGFISMFVIILLLFAAPLVISRTINIIKAKCGSQQQQPKRRDIVLFLVVLFTLLLNLWIFLQQLGYTAASSLVFFLLACINSTIKPFIYFLVGRCWRPCSVSSLKASLRRVFEEPEEETSSSNDAAMGTVI